MCSFSKYFIDGEQYIILLSLIVLISILKYSRKMRFYIIHLDKANKLNSLYNPAKDKECSNFT